MAKGANQKLKLLYLMKIFLEETDENHTVSVSDLIQKLDSLNISAERKSLYDDFEALRAFGIPVEMSRGQNRGYFVAERTFELPELKLLVDAVQSSKFITKKKSDELIGKIEKLTSVYKARSLARQVYVSNRIKTMNESIYYTVDYIHDAISENHKISFCYYEWNVKKEKVLRHNGKRYKVSPFALTWDDENYYMIAVDSESGEVRHYRVDKMTKLEISEEVRQGAERFKYFDSGLYSKKTFGMFSGYDEIVTLRCSDRLIGVIIDRFGSDIIPRDLKNGFFEVSVKVAVSPTFFGWVMSFGREMRILSPEKVKDEFMELAKSAAEIQENET